MLKINEIPFAVYIMEEKIYEKIREANLSDIAPGGVPEDADSIIDYLINIRKELRKAKQFQLADETRNRLNELGITLEDTPQGTIWKRKR